MAIGGIPHPFTGDKNVSRLGKINKKEINCAKRLVQQGINGAFYEVGDQFQCLCFWFHT